ncbi:MAG: 30S ribosome-binding factor RbfA [Candidatus Accumulibacter sp.]|uniref:30S ribosome-binding factor RbfA n=1 Tax=Candidatus Accumulibacter TaxID=327159 RepID=UPI001ACCBD99|nr:30S ribosome-binding factor RbfA [Accumulibacter sp.]MBK8113950.1 30S ribosome-binding factor RbfA [Accumulibacter sp.]MBK8385505.1 30S ribosome-binding factor RbfA [Accumulibacter sp.]MBK8577911.1 30S ribosome-binding factor RbfA [Candidatus Accumulibacter propinquus]MBN8438570.1 30S ribosome-binding factor RbfA [Accumulibacter sp.]
MATNRGFSRRDRIAEQIRRELAEVIRTELRDPRVGMISLTDVQVSPDYAHAKIFFSSLAGSDTLESVQEGLEKAAGFLRSELGKRISIHMTPQLHFVFDESLERGAQLSKLISEAVAISDQDHQA